MALTESNCTHRIFRWGPPGVSCYLSNNNAVSEFYPAGAKTNFKIRCVLDFYGPSDFVMLASSPDTSINSDRNPVARLIGAMPAQRPDLAKRASPVTYVDKNDPPFFIVQGEKDESVPNTICGVILASFWQGSLSIYDVPGRPTTADVRC
jgi:acetyl esterase/lipase